MERKAKVVAWAVTYNNVREARRRYLQEFGEEAPCEPTIRRWVARFLEFGDINKRQPGSGRPVTASGDDQGCSGGVTRYNAVILPKILAETALDFLRSSKTYIYRLYLYNRLYFPKFS